ncbi:MAG: rRNA maturation RNase YbeY, partial [Gemmatimonas sp.]
MTLSSERAVAVQADGVRCPVALARLEELVRRVLGALRVPHALLSVTVVSPRAIARLNRQHLGHAGPTDVITFTLASHVANAVVADIYICPDVAREQARRHGVGVREEIARL